MSINVIVPWVCTCCIPACSKPGPTNTGQGLVKTLDPIEYLQLYYAEELSITGYYQLDSRVDLPSGTYIEYRLEGPSLPASGSRNDQGAGCYKFVEAAATQTGGTVITQVPRDGSPDYVVEVDSSTALKAYYYLHKDGSTLELWGRFLAGNAGGSQGLCYPDIGFTLGNSTGGSKTITAEGESLSPYSFGADGFGSTAVYTSNSNGSLTATATLATPP
jgi:hypothetical protein